MVNQVIEFLKKSPAIKLSEEELRCIQAGRRVIEEALAAGKTIYGINTGFGKLSQVRIAAEELQQLQVNLLRSHACGVGEPLATEIVRIMLYLKYLALAQGYSGCSLEVVQKIIEFLNRDILPVVPRRGSVGASGDLAPLAHMSLPLIGEGEVVYQGVRRPAADLVTMGVYQPIELRAKDGLALINGTQFSTALLLYGFYQAEQLLLLDELAAAMCVEAALATDVPFRAEIQAVRKQRGQIAVARHLRNFLSGSQIVASHKDCPKVQDPYCLRCVPQVLGAVRDTLDFVRMVLEREIAAVTDNPLVFPESTVVLSGGNFHAEPLALAADYLAIALTNMGNMAERRIALLTDAAMSGLPAFLVAKSGLNSGFMIVQVTAAALCAENRTLSNPASVQNIPTSANQEDHVSMAPNAGLKLLQILENLKTIIWIELLAAAQGMELRRPLKGGEGTERGWQQVRRLVPFYAADRRFDEDLNQRDAFYADQQFLEELRQIAER
jgi:histidine ammonia-lyase